MGQTREIKYATMQGTSGATVVYSDATTWGALKAEFTDIGAKAMGMKAIIRQNKIELTNDQQSLPEGNFEMYFVVEKNNSGTPEEIDAIIEAFLAKQ